MKNKSMFGVGFLLLLFNVVTAQQGWTRKADVGGGPRADAASFSIGTKGYLGVGSFRNDFWEYDPATNIWTQKADFAGKARGAATGFSLNGKGYVGTGYADGLSQSDFWEYNPTTNAWTQKASLDGGARGYATSFSIGGKGYIGLGQHEAGLMNDFWEYNPAADKWNQKADYAGSGTLLPSGVAIGNKGYIMSDSDFQEFDPVLNKWEQKVNFPGVSRILPSRFSIGDKGYFGTGINSQGVLNDFWEYSADDNSWTRKTDFPGSPRYLVAGFSIGKKGYMGVGYVYSDFYEYDPGRDMIGSDNGLQAEYFNNTNLAAPSVLTRIDTGINNDFVFKSPAPGTVNTENYSVRWSGQVKPQFSEIYTFYAVTDDGVRLWVNGILLVDNWNNQGATEKSGSIALQAGQLYDIEMEYFQGSGLAVSKLLWSSPGTPKAIIPAAQLYLPVAGSGTGLRGEYFNNTGLTAPSVLVRTDAVINNDFVFKSPAPGSVNIENYAVRWTGQVKPRYSETYTFYAVTDDGVRLWVNGVLLIDNWTNQGATEKSGSIALEAGQQYDVEMEYYQGGGLAVSKLLWSGASTAKAIIPRGQLYPPVSDGTGLQAVYFNNTGLTGPAVLSRIDPVINNDFIFKSPAPGTVNIENYSVRWTGQVKTQFSETYTFYTTTDDGVRLWVNGVLLIDNWINQGATEKSSSIDLQADQKYNIVMEYFQSTGFAVSKLLWSSTSTAKAIVPKTRLFPDLAAARMMDAAANLRTPAAPAVVNNAGVYPNPVKAGRPATLQLASNSTGTVMVQLLGGDGAVLRREKQQLVAGVNTILVKTAGLAQGIYIVNISGAGKPVNFKLMVE